MMTTAERVIPVLVYRDIQAAHDFLVEAFGFGSGGVDYGPSSEAVHGEVRVGATDIWLHRATEEYDLDSPVKVDTAGAGIVVRVSDVDAHFERARAGGAQIAYAPTDQPYGQREYEAQDPEGHRWWFATPVAKPRKS